MKDVVISTNSFDIQSTFNFHFFIVTISRTGEQGWDFTFWIRSWQCIACGPEMNCDLLVFNPHLRVFITIWNSFVFLITKNKIFSDREITQNSNVPVHILSLTGAQPHSFIHVFCVSVLESQSWPAWQRPSGP